MNFDKPIYITILATFCLGIIGTILKNNKAKHKKLIENHSMTASQVVVENIFTAVFVVIGFGAFIVALLRTNNEYTDAVNWTIFIKTIILAYLVNAVLYIIYRIVKFITK